jgi:hypothetical protein
MPKVVATLLLRDVSIRESGNSDVGQIRYQIQFFGGLNCVLFKPFVLHRFPTLFNDTKESGPTAFTYPQQTLPRIV